MKKKIWLILAVLLTTGFTPLYAQLAVAVVADSADTISSRINDFINQVQQLYQMIEQVRLANETLQTQLKAIQSLGEGDFNSFFDAFDYQAQTVSNFSNLLNGFDYLKEYEEIGQMLESEEFIGFSDEVEALDRVMEASNNFLRQTQGLIRNTEMRIDAQKQIQALARSKDSLVGQLQLTNQSLGLISGGLADLLTASMALNNAVLVQEENEKLKEKLDEKIIKEFLFEEGNWDSNVSVDVYMDTLMNIPQEEDKKKKK